MIVWLIGYMFCIFGYVFTVVSVVGNTKRNMLVFSGICSICSILTCIFWGRWFEILPSLVNISAFAYAIYCDNKKAYSKVLIIILVLLVGAFRTLSHEENPYVYLINIIVKMVCMVMIFTTKTATQLRYVAFVEAAIGFITNMVTDYYFMGFVEFVVISAIAIKLYLDKKKELEKYR